MPEPAPDAPPPSDDYTFICDRKTKRSVRILEHPSKTNQRHSIKLRFCHPRNPRTRISNATFKELKDTLNQWKPDTIVDKPYTTERIYMSNHSEERVIMNKCLIRGKEKIEDMELISVFKHGHDPRGLISVLIPETDIIDYLYCLKVVLFDKRQQLFLLRTSINRGSAIRAGNLKSIDNHSYDPEWCVHLSTLLALREFWVVLKEIINSV